MATFQLMAPTSVIGDDPADNITPLAVPGNPTRTSYTLSITGPANSYCAATVLATVDGQTWCPVQVLTIEPTGGNQPVTADQLDAPNYILYDAQLNYISRGAMASLTLTV